jgi:uncharacterized phiE125 gp8 family phage protein
LAVALAANALTTLATAKAELGLTGTAENDSVLERLINTASDAAERYCRRSFTRATVTSERVKGYGGPRLMVARTPVVSVTSVIINGSTVDATSYYLESPEAGTLYRDAGWDWTALADAGLVVQDAVPGTEEGLYLVTYVGGYQAPNQGGTRTLPYDLEQAVLDTVTQLWRNRGKYSSLQTETESQEDATWRGFVIPGPARHVLNLYRRISV